MHALLVNVTSVVQHGVPITTTEGEGLGRSRRCDLGVGSGPPHIDDYAYTVIVLVLKLALIT